MSQSPASKASNLEHQQSIAADLPRISVTARASIVNRTHRVVRERAQQLAARRNKIRSLWAPMAICGALLVILSTAGWSILDQYELAPTGVVDSSDQFLVLAFWFLPVSMTVLALVWFRRVRNQRIYGGDHRR